MKPIFPALFLKENNPYIINIISFIEEDLKIKIKEEGEPEYIIRKQEDEKAEKEKGDNEKEEEEKEEIKYVKNEEGNKIENKYLFTPEEFLTKDKK